MNRTFKKKREENKGEKMSSVFVQNVFFILFFEKNLTKPKGNS